MASFILITAGYLIGAIPFGYIVARARGVDIFAQGSGNIGATNVGRVLGRRFGIFVFFLDFAKGAIPVILAHWLTDSLESKQRAWLEVGTGLAAFLGHLFPIYLGFRGGKGVATGAGVVAVLVPIPTLGAALTWGVVAASSRYVSLASILAVVALCVCQLLLGGPVNFEQIDPRLAFCLLGTGLVIVRHRSNLMRLWRGTENQLGENLMHPISKSLHVLALGLWFGSAIFFTFVVGLSLFSTFEALGKQSDRPAWFPQAEAFRKADANIDGPKEQGSRVAGYAVSPMFSYYFLLQGICGLIALVTAIGLAKTSGRRVERWRVSLILGAFVLVLCGWPIERYVSELRTPRNQATEVYLQANDTEAAALLEPMKVARANFGRWHLMSLFMNLAVVGLVTGATALAGHLPPCTPLAKDSIC